MARFALALLALPTAEATEQMNFVRQVVCPPAQRSDCTAALQAGLDDATARHVVIGAGEWQTQPLRLNRSDVVLELAPGSVLQAVRGKYHGGDDTVLTVGPGARNVTVLGAGASIRMWRTDYRNLSLYSKAEWRAGVQFLDSSDVTLTGLTIEETGGDGVCLLRTIYMQCVHRDLHTRILRTVIAHI